MRLFDVLGPVMIGPSSSHTAGAARIGYTAPKLLGAIPAEAGIGLYCMFSPPGRGGPGKKKPNQARPPYRRFSGHREQRAPPQR